MSECYFLEDWMIRTCPADQARLLSTVDAMDRRQLAEHPGYAITRQYIQSEFVHWTWPFPGPGPDPEKLREWTGMACDMTTIVDMPGVGVLRVPSSVVGDEVKLVLTEGLLARLGVYMHRLRHGIIPRVAGDADPNQLSSRLKEIVEKETKRPTRRGDRRLLR